MLIDWFTVGAQALNFLILVWLMKRFLYKPILDAIDAREQRIAAELADADAKSDAAQKERDKFQHKNEEFDQQRAALLSQATDEVTAERQRLLDEARAAANDLSAKRQEALRREQESLAGEITRRTREEVFAIARKTLADLAGASLEERISDVFTAPSARAERRGKGWFRQCLAIVIYTGCRTQHVRLASGATRRNPTCAQRNVRGRNPTQFRDRADGD